MTSNNQVSPVIRISQENRDASARATHLEAANGKFLLTTNERKQMSTKTNFKRVALVAVAALGLGVLSSVPSQATFLSTPTVTTVSGTATKAQSDSATSGASVTVSYLSNTTDSVVVSSVISSFPGTVTPRLLLSFGDTVGSTVAVATPGGLTAYGDSVVTTAAGAGATINTPAGGGRVTMNLKAFLDTSVARAVGSYVFTVVATPSSGGVAGTPITANITIAVAALDSESTVASAGTSTAYLTTTASDSSATADQTPSVLATVSSTDTPRAYIYVNLKNASGAAVKESITLTTTIGNIGTSAIRGKSVVVPYTGPGSYNIYSDGTAGNAVVTVKSTSVTFANKSVAFYSATPATLVATTLNSVPGVGTTTSAVQVVAKDSNGNLWGGSLAIYSDALTTISDTGTACTSYVSTLGVHICSVTGVAAGTAKLTVRDASLGVKSNELSMTVSVGTPASVKLAWDKTSYAPGEKATLAVTVLDSTGKAIPASTFSNLFTAGGISLSAAAGNGSDTLTAISITTASPAAGAIGTSTEPQKLYTVYMPSSGATVTAKATGGTSLPLTGQVAVSASATVTDNGAAALAAVTALATTVASLKTLITTLTNLVLKIQKKVKA